MFTPDGDTVFLSEEQDALGSGEKAVTNIASRQVGDKFVPVEKGGGLYTTQLHDREKKALQMGSASVGVQPTSSVPFSKDPQQRHHLQYAMPKKKSSSRTSDRKMSEQQKVERR